MDTQAQTPGNVEGGDSLISSHLLLLGSSFYELPHEREEIANLIGRLGVSDWALFPGGWDYCASKANAHSQPFLRLKQGFLGQASHLCEPTLCV